MRRFLLLAPFAAVLAAAVQPRTAEAQSQCAAVPPGAPANSPARVTADACNRASDVFQFLAPQLAAAMAGGNPSPGIGGTLGGFPHVNVGVRANLVQSDLPRLDEADALSIDGARATEIPVTQSLLVVPQVDAQVGLFRGFKLGLPLPGLGLTNLFGVDALLSATFLPNASVGTTGAGLSLEGGALAIGYGARLGLLEETMIVPGLSLSWMSRPTPSLSVVATAANDTIGVRNLSVSTTSWRITAAKTIPIIGLGVSAGYGQDAIDGKADLDLAVNEASLSPARYTARAAFTQSTSRTNLFVGAHVKLFLVRIGAEAGWVSGGDARVLRNAFTRDGEIVAPMARRMYGTVSARIGF
jgi:hypothetical protein